MCPFPTPPLQHRLSETGEGHFFFTGRHAYRLFEAMKTELMARAQQKTQTQTQTQNRSLPSSLESVATGTNLSRSVSSASAMNMKQKHPLAANSHVHSNGQTSSPAAGQKAPLDSRLSHSNRPLPAKSSASLEESETSSEDYSPSDNSSSFTGTGGSLHDWTTPSPTPLTGNGLFDRPPILPPRILDGRPFSPCSTTSSSSSSTSGYNVPRRAYLPPTPPSPSLGQPRYMQVKREEMDSDSDYMTMNSALRRKTPPTTGETPGNEDEEEKEEEEDDEEYADEYLDTYTDMQSAPTDTRKDTPSDNADQYMRMVPIGGVQIGTPTRSCGDPAHPTQLSSVPPSPPPQIASRFRELTIMESLSNTFPGASS